MSTAYSIIRLDDPQEALIQRFGVEGGYTGPSEEESPWVPYGEGAAIRHLAFDVRANTYCNILWIKAAGMIGTHKHHGQVSMFVLEGSMRYLEYDWVARPGGFIYETPGQAHTLVTDEGVKVLGWQQGSTDYYDAEGKYTETLDVFWFINHYVGHCEENGLPINDKLFL